MLAVGPVVASTHLLPNGLPFSDQPASPMETNYRCGTLTMTTTHRSPIFPNLLVGQLLMPSNMLVMLLNAGTALSIFPDEICSKLRIFFSSMGVDKNYSPSF